MFPLIHSATLMGMLSGISRVFVLAAASNCASVLSAADHLDAIERRLTSLANVSVRFRKTEAFTPLIPKTEKPKPSRIVIRSNTTRSECLFRFLAGRAYYESTLIEATPPQDADMAERIDAFPGDRVEHLWLEAGTSQRYGVIRNDEARENTDIIDLAIGLSMAHGTSWMTHQDLRATAVRLSEDGDKIFMERVDKKGRRHEWVFNSQSYALLRYHVYSSRGWLYLALENADFVTIEDVALPRSSRMHFYHEKKGVRRETKRVDSDVIEWIVNDPKNKAFDFLIKWPLEASVLDARTGTTMRVVSEPRVLTNDVLAKAAKSTPRSDPKHRPNPPSALGVWRYVFFANCIGLVTLIAIWCLRRPKPK